MARVKFKASRIDALVFTSRKYHPNPETEEELLDNKYREVASWHSERKVVGVPPQLYTKFFGEEIKIDRKDVSRYINNGFKIYTKL